MELLHSCKDGRHELGHLKIRGARGVGRAARIPDRGDQSRSQ